MNLQSYIQAIQVDLISTHDRVLACFNLDEKQKSYRPVDNGWTIREILEHIALTSHYLLILIDKGADKALKNVQQLDLEGEMMSATFDLGHIDRIGMHKSFDWIRPEHMEPTGQKSDFEIKSELVEQLRRCLNHLDRLKGGEGLLYKTTMTVDGLGKLNVYEYILFLSKHAARHLMQIEENLAEMPATNS